MRSSDISFTIFIIVVFILLFTHSALGVGIKHVKDNWPLYRSNPLFMPFAGLFGHDVKDNFVHSVQNIFMDMLGYLLQPLHYLMSVINEVTSGLTDAVQDIRKFFNFFRNAISSAFGSIFSVFLNILTQFQFILIKIKDMIGKIVGVMAAMMYILQGSVMTMQSTWNGPPGEMVRIMSSIRI